MRDPSLRASFKTSNISLCQTLWQCEIESIVSCEQHKFLSAAAGWMSGPFF
jgi:hypothetical protein